MRREIFLDYMAWERVRNKMGKDGEMVHKDFGGGEE